MPGRTMLSLSVAPSRRCEYFYSALHQARMRKHSCSYGAGSAQVSVSSAATGKSSARTPPQGLQRHCAQRSAVTCKCVHGA